MPQDQGGYVGIQFSGSHYDGNSNVYDVTHYSVWRELDTDGSSSIEAQPTPDGRYFRLNTRNTNAWEYIGDTPAQEFDNYGYTAPTIADSNHIGMFTSNFLVVAHTDDDDVFFSFKLTLSMLLSGGFSWFILWMFWLAEQLFLKLFGNVEHTAQLIGGFHSFLTG